MKKTPPYSIFLIAWFIASCVTAEERIPQPTTVIRLEAKDARLKTTAQLRVEEGEFSYHIGWWTRLDDEISWNLVITEGGDYAVLAAVSCATEYDGSTVSVSVNKQSLSFRVSGTESWTRYATITLGKVALAPGTYQVVVTAVRISGAFVCNVGSLTFQK